MIRAEIEQQRVWRQLASVVDDPSGLTVEEVRPIRDDIESRVRALMGELGVEPVR